MNREIERRPEDEAFAPRRSLWRRIKDVALMDVAVLVQGVDEDAIERLEERLLEADFGVPATLHLAAEIEAEAKRGKLVTESDFRRLLQQRIVELLREVPQGETLARAELPPTVILVVGVNGVGKTTTVARLARKLQARGEVVLLAAADTFRAGAIEQVTEWGERLGAEVVASSQGGDPAAVVFDAIDAAIARGASYVVADTAGRLHTQTDLMTELAKVVCVASKRLEGAPHEVLLCLDATTGQNALNQARTFADRLPLTGLVVCKLDGTARGGVVVAVTRELRVPIKFVGLGEGPDDITTFEPELFAEGLVR